MSIKFKTALLSFIFISIQLFAKESNEIGLYGAICFKPSYYIGKLSYTTGTRLGIILGDNLSLGISLNATTIANPVVPYLDTTYSANPHIDYIYYGADTEYFLNPEKEIHPSLSLFVGRGRVNLSINTGEKVLNPLPYTEYSYFLLLEPMINLNLNFKSFYRISLGLGYKFALGSDFKPTNTGLKFGDNDLSGFLAHLTIKFGKF